MVEVLSIQQGCKILLSFFFFGGVSAMFLSRASSAWTRELFLLLSGAEMWVLCCSPAPPLP